jgi:NAD+ kinase
MPSQFNRIGLWGEFSDRSVGELATLLSAHLVTRGMQVFAPRDVHDWPDSHAIQLVSSTEFREHVDLLVAIGGDGNLLRASRCIAGCDVPIIGVNRGRLGFLTDVKPDQMVAALDAILDGDHLSEQRLLLEARIQDADGAIQCLRALNDVVLQKTLSGRLLDFETTVDGRYVNTAGGDGLIVATPTGSTAYALSCGGPIIQPGVAALVMVPICPHMLSDRPLVLRSASRIRIRIPAYSEGRALVICDGEELGQLHGAQVLEIAAATDTVTLLHPRDYDYYELLRSKLNWGARGHRAKQ